jgi:hypothetical protein
MPSFRTALRLIGRSRDPGVLLAARKLLVAVATLTLAPVSGAAAAGTGAPTPACPVFGFQMAADGGFYLQPLTYERVGRTEVRVRFSYQTIAHGRRVVAVRYPLRGREPVLSITAWTQKAPGARRSSTIKCVPDLARARRPRVSVGYRPRWAKLPLALVWAIPGKRVGPAVRPVRTGGSVGVGAQGTLLAPLPAGPLAIPAGFGHDGGEAPAVAAPPETPVAPKDAYTVIASGDISECINNVTGQPAMGQHPGKGAIATAKMIADAGPLDAILELGDAVYESGTPGEFADCYDKTWGPFKPITHPVPGNHEYRCGRNVLSGGCTAPAKGYYDYFGAAAGPRGLGYYSFDIGPWHVVALNSETDGSPTAAASSAQRAWLLQDLALHPSRCTLAMWHKPAYSNDPLHGDNPTMQVYLKDLYAAGVDLLVQGHVHAYERWGELGPTGAPEPGRGVRSMIAGLGGANITGANSGRPGQEVTYNGNYGLLKLTLTATGYSWDWLNAPDNTSPGVQGQLKDSGTTACH